MGCSPGSKFTCILYFGPVRKTGSAIYAVCVCVSRVRPLRAGFV